MSNEASRAGFGGCTTQRSQAHRCGSRIGRALLPAVAAVGMVATVAAGCATAQQQAARQGVRATPRFEPVQSELFAAAGAQPIAVADFDGDGRQDVFVGFRGLANRLYRSNGDGTFADVAKQAGVADEQDTRAAAWGDYDGDGLVDLYVGYTSRSPVANRLYRNKGDGTFAPVEGALPDTKGNTRQVSWVDFDNDGDLDLFVALREQPNQLLRNDSGRFTDVAAAVGVADPRKTVGAAWFDYNADGRLDLFVANQDGDLNGFFRNDGGRFVDIAAEMEMDGAAQRALGSDHGGVGVSVSDFNNDGRLDLYLANYGPDQLFLNDGNGRFRDVASEVGVADDHHSVTASSGDFDNDGRVDVYVTTFLANEPNAPDQLYQNLGASFVDVMTPSLTPRDATHGVQWLDIDGDGSLDLLLANNGNEGSHPVYRNHLPQSQARRSLQVLVQDADGRLTRAGSEVRLYRPGTRDVLGARLVDTGGGYSSQNAMPVHFGLGDHQGPVDVEVTYLTSAGPRVVRVANVGPEQWVGRPLVVRPDQNRASQ